MADLLSILANAASSLQAQRALTATASHNIQNANTPGYARQRASLEAVEPAEVVNGVYIGRGSTLTTVTQVRDRFVEAQLGGAIANAARSTAESEALASLSSLDASAQGGLGAAISGFYGALRNLSQNASDAGLRTTVLGSARTMAYAFNRTAQEVAAARTALDSQVTGLAEQVNEEARAVADLNLQIRASRVGGHEPNDLLDLRQRHVDKLAELVGAITVETSEGDVNMVLPGGVGLVGGGLHATLSTAIDVANDRHLRLQLTAMDGSGPTAVANAAFSGTLGGSLAARDGGLRDTAAKLDQLAFDLAGALNAVHSAGAGLDGVSGRNLFVAPAAVSGAAGRLAVQVTDASQLAAAAAPVPPATVAPGDASNAQALVATESQALSTGVDVQATFSAIISSYGSETQRASAFATQDRAMRDNLEGMREAASGVSIDEELIEMQRAQRGYEAIAKIIQTADAMLQTLMQLR
ncbi:MAG: flagellar hook-associated protein FlgK [Deltaproteobacteria bacterium]|nr:flagellar hook-associated protein FlgK [Deltaproteobacteria bacterium]